MSLLTDLQQFRGNLAEEGLHVVRGLGRRLQELHAVPLGELVPDLGRDLAVVAVSLVACEWRER